MVFLDALPNELLVKIFSKTKKKTTRECRLLNKRMNSVINRYELNKDDVQELRIWPLTWNDAFQSITCQIEINQQKTNRSYKNHEAKRTFENYDELLRTLPYIAKNIRHLKSLCLIYVGINNELLDVLNKKQCFRHIRELSVSRCKLDVSGERWTNYLESLDLEAFRLETNDERPLFLVPPTMLNRVSSRYAYHYGGRTPSNAVNMNWLDYEMFDNWFTSDKRFELINARTGLTLDGIITFINKWADSTDTIYLELGRIQDVHPNVLEITLDQQGLEYDSSNMMDGLLRYWVVFGDEHTIYFGVNKPENWRHHDDDED